eukprot:3083915-Amphidinium_carterae.1
MTHGVDQGKSMPREVWVAAGETVMPEGATSSGSGDARAASQEARAGEVIPMEETSAQGDMTEPKARSLPHPERKPNAEAVATGHSPRNTLTPCSLV